MKSYNDYPTKPIGNGNPYHQCSYCGVSVPEINGRLDGHRTWCEYRKSHETKIKEERIKEKAKLIQNLKGTVTDAQYAFQRHTKVFAVAHYYNEPGEPDYIKWTCPICDFFDNVHQVHEWEKNCTQCGVNLDWDREELRKVQGISLTHEGRVGNCPHCGKFIREDENSEICNHCDKAVVWSQKKELSL